VFFFLTKSELNFHFIWGNMKLFFDLFIGKHQ